MGYEMFHSLNVEVIDGKALLSPEGDEMFPQQRDAQAGVQPVAVPIGV